MSDFADLLKALDQNKLWEENPLEAIWFPTLFELGLSDRDLHDILKKQAARVLAHLHTDAEPGKTQSTKRVEGAIRVSKALELLKDERVFTAVLKELRKERSERITHERIGNEALGTKAQEMRRLANRANELVRELEAEQRRSERYKQRLQDIASGKDRLIEAELLWRETNRSQRLASIDTRAKLTVLSFHFETARSLPTKDGKAEFISRVDQTAKKAGPPSSTSPTWRGLYDDWHIHAYGGIALSTLMARVLSRHEMFSTVNHRESTALEEIGGHGHFVGFRYSLRFTEEHQLDFLSDPTYAGLPAEKLNHAFREALRFIQNRLSTAAKYVRNASFWIRQIEVEDGYIVDAQENKTEPRRGEIIQSFAQLVPLVGTVKYDDFPERLPRILAPNSKGYFEAQRLVFTEDFVLDTFQPHLEVGSMLLTSDRKLSVPIRKGVRPTLLARPRELSEYWGTDFVLDIVT